MLGENTSQIDLGGFGGAVRLLSSPIGEGFFAHRNARPIGTDIQDGCVGLAQEPLALLPLLGRGPHVLSPSLDLTARNADPSGFSQVSLRFLKSGFVGALQAHQARQRRGIPFFPTQGGIRRKMTGSLEWVVIVFAGDREGAKEALDLQDLTSLEMLAPFGLVSLINAIGSLLEQEPNDGPGGFENGGTDQKFQLLHGLARGSLGGEPRHQLRDLGLIKQ